MAKYDAHEYRSGEGYLLDVQADLLDHLNTRIVVPLLPKDQAPQPATRLNPIFEIDGRTFVMATQFLSAVPKGELGLKVANFEQNFSEITVALDMVFQGF
jgi:toxin CcdB